MDEYLTTHRSWDGNQRVPFPVRCAEGEDEVYRDHLWGMSIVSVTADGEAVAAEEADLDLDDIDQRKIGVEHRTFIYNVPLANLMFAKSFDEEDYELLQYQVSPEAKEIRFEYRVRHGNDQFGPAQVITSKLID